MKNAFYAQSGGVTSVINSSAFGLFSELKEKVPEANIYVGKNGIVGLIDNEVYEYQKKRGIYLFDNIQYLKVKNSLTEWNI